MLITPCVRRQMEIRFDGFQFIEQLKIILSMVIPPVFVIEGAGYYADKLMPHVVGHELV